MTLSSPSLAPDWRHPAILVRGVDQTVGMRLRLAGVVQTPTACTLAVYRDTARTDLYSAPTVTPGTTSTADTAVIPTTEPYSNQWVLGWSPTVGGVAYYFQRRALLVERAPEPRVDQEDFRTFEPELLTAARIPKGQTTWTPQILEAWYQVIRSLTAAGNSPVKYEIRYRVRPYTW